MERTIKIKNKLKAFVEEYVSICLNSWYLVQLFGCLSFSLFDFSNLSLFTFYGMRWISCCYPKPFLPNHHRRPIFSCYHEVLSFPWSHSLLFFSLHHYLQCQERPQIPEVHQLKTLMLLEKLRLGEKFCLKEICFSLHLIQKNQREGSC